MWQVLTCAILVFAVGCMHVSPKITKGPCKPPGARYTAKPALIDSWSPEKILKEPYEAPFVTKYSDGEKTLAFVSVHHSTEVDSPTFKTLKDLVAEFKPEVVIFEGYPTANGYSPQYISDKNQKFANENFSHSGEMFYAAHLACEAGVPFVGGEPTDKEILKALRPRGISLHDLVSFYAVRWIPQIKMEKNGQDIETAVNDRIAKAFKELETDEPNFRFKDVRAWYLKKTGRELNIGELHAEDLAPNYEPEAPYLQHFSSLVERARNEHILQVIVNELNQHDRVLIEYGSGHHVELKPALRPLFPRIEPRKLY